MHESGEHQHEGSFASGRERSEHHPEDEPEGSFGRRSGAPESDHEGTFATGSESVEGHPEHGTHGDFAEGQER